MAFCVAHGTVPMHGCGPVGGPAAEYVLISESRGTCAQPFWLKAMGGAHAESVHVPMKSLSR